LPLCFLLYFLRLNCVCGFSGISANTGGAAAFRADFQMRRRAVVSFDLFLCLITR